MKAAHLRTALFGFVSLSCATQSFEGVDRDESDASDPASPLDAASESDADVKTADAASDLHDASVGEPPGPSEAGQSETVEASVSPTDASRDDSVDGDDKPLNNQGDAQAPLRPDAGPTLDAAASSDSAGDNTDAGGQATGTSETDAAVGAPCPDAGSDAALSCEVACASEGACDPIDANPPAAECRRGGSPCATSEIERLNGEHVVDGYGDEFCDIPGFELNFSNAALGGADLPQAALVRVAWSPEALHVFAEVSDPEIATNSNIDWLWDGDTVELYLATTEASQLTGFFTGRIDGVQLVFAPPSSEHAARAARLFWLPNDNGSWRQVREEVTRDFSSRVTEDGYAVEAKIPWSRFGPRAPELEAGMAIAFNLALSTASAQSLRDGGREGAAVLFVGDAARGVETCDGEQMPWCNSTTWCSPVLQ